MSEEQPYRFMTSRRHEKLFIWDVLNQRGWWINPSGKVHTSVGEITDAPEYFTELPFEKAKELYDQLVGT